MVHSELEKILKNIKNIYISSRECCRYNAQSCDCMELVIDTGEKMISVVHREFGEDGCIELEEIHELNKEVYKYKMLMYDEQFELERISNFDNGLIDAIKFKYKDVFLFVFALEDNLVLTKSKYDLLDETTKDFFEEEATLEITNNI